MAGLLPPGRMDLSRQTRTLRYNRRAATKACRPKGIGEIAPRAQWQGSKEPETVRNCTKDEGRPFEAVLQGKASNHLKLLWSKAMVVSV